jgi:hypothetical protein
MIDEINAKTCGHTRYTLHLGELYLDARYFADKCTYVGCEERKAASPKILERLSEELRQCKRERNISDNDFSEIIDVISRKIIAQVKELFPKWASTPIEFNVEAERAISGIARREKAIAVDYIESGNIDEYLGRKQFDFFDEESHYVYLKTVDCHWADAEDGEHWFKFGKSKDPLKRYSGEQVSLDQKLTFGLKLPIAESRCNDFESCMKTLIAQAAFKTPLNEGAKKREKFQCTMHDAARLFREAYRRTRI